ncbi:recombinase family protein [Streptomyces sp. V1I1]|uniref:recombinase family protein n=1 Tax=Streptomyces sp. V1I1 TaxID=3042272 RepID=UPI00278517A0|nr:recombinase family protein [Streptomyces sp. V1I1]MDQ0943163.1 site-specific DNA recombinase [Streptomyces sp. V1I1]
MQPQLNIIERVQRRDLTGLKIAGLVRLSFELLDDADYNGPVLTGADINNREEQERLCREYIERFGGTYVGTYNEPDTSAWKKRRIKQPDGSHKYRVIRPILYGALDDLRAGRPVSKHFIPAEGFDKLTAADGIIVYDLDRLTRDQRTLEDIIEVAENYTRPFIDITGSLDLLTENGRDNARMLVTMAGKSSSASARRGKTSHLARAMRGIPVGGNRPFGWADDKRTVIPEEAEQIRQAAKDVLADISPTTIVNKWNAAGKRTTQGNEWRRRTLILMLLSPRMVGWRVHGPAEIPPHKRYLTGPDGEPVKGQYDGILKEETWHAVVDKLTSDDRPGAGVYVGRLKYELSGIIRCGNCGRPMTGQAKANNRFDYVCKPPAYYGGCGKVAGSGIAIDKLAQDLLFARYDEHKVTVEVGPWPKAGELEQAKTKKAGLLAQFKENADMGAYIWPEIRKLDSEIADLMKDRSKYIRQTAGPKVTSIAEQWPDLALEQRQAIYSETFAAIILNRATRGSNRFDPSRLQVIWHQE